MKSQRRLNLLTIAILALCTQFALAQANQPLGQRIPRNRRR